MLCNGKSLIIPKVLEFSGVALDENDPVKPTFKVKQQKSYSQVPQPLIQQKQETKEDTVKLSPLKYCEEK